MTRAISSPLLLLLLLLLSDFAGGARAQSTRIVAPDIGGMLYPMQSPRYERVDFGTLQAATLFAATVSSDSANPDNAGSTAPDSSLSKAPCAAKLCVDLLLTSDFAADPFLLTRYEARNPVASSLLDGHPSAIQPVITGSPDTSDSQVQTLWHFSTNASDLNGLPAVDVLLRLKQQSQFRSSKDQLLLHFVATRKSELSVTTAIESYSVYGNARVTHETSRVDSRRLQIAFKIARDASVPDVRLDDAYPLAIQFDTSSPTSSASNGSWKHVEPECAQCAALLYNCPSVDELQSGTCDYDSTSAPLVQCMRDTYQQTSAAFASLLEQHQVDFEAPVDTLLSNCFDKLIQDDDAAFVSNNTAVSLSLQSRSWWNSTVALSCLARLRCPFGPLNSVYLEDRSPDKMLVLTNATELVHTVRITGSVFSGYFELAFGSSSSSSSSTNLARVSTMILTQDSYESDFIAALQLAIGMQGLVIRVQKTFDGIAWQLTITYLNLLFPNLVSQFKLSDPSASSSFDETRLRASFSKLQVSGFNAARLVFEGKCDVCTENLSQCQQSDSCRNSGVMQCLLRQLTTEWLPQQRAQVEYVPEFGKSRLDVLEAFSECTGNLSVATWNSVRKAFLCFAQQGCVAGASQTVFKVENGSQVFVVPLNTDTETVTLNFSSQSGSDESQRFNFQSPIADLPFVIRGFVLHNNGDVAQSSRADPLDGSRVEITLTYSNLLGALPQISAPGGISWLHNAPPPVYFEYNDEDETQNALPSLVKLINVLQEKILPLSSVGAQANHSWTLATYCVSCSAKLFTCSSETVKNRTCHYGSMASPFGRCLREQLPMRVYQELLDPTSSVNATDSSVGVAPSSGSMGIRNEIAFCARMVSNTAAVDSATASPPTTAATLDSEPLSTLTLNAALGCFASNKCPFGPLEAVNSSEVVLLDTASYIHLVRIHNARSFQITLEFRFADKTSFAQAALDDSSTRLAVNLMLNAKLFASGISASVVTFDHDAGGTEWTMEFRYDNVVLPSFSVAVASNSVPAQSAIEQMFMKSSPRLVVTPRDPLKLYEGSLPPDPTSDAPTSTSPTTNSFDASNYAFGGAYGCSQCGSWIQVCRRSRYCSSVLSCLLSQLQNFLPLMSGSTETDMTEWLQSCASSQSPMAVNAWWSPLQRFLACYARSKCKVSRMWTALSGEPDFAISDTVLSLRQGEESLLVPLTDVSSRTFSLMISPPGNGTNFAPQDSFQFTGNSSRLERFLTYLTMDAASNITVTVAAESNGGLTQVNISYGDDYVGSLPRISSGYSSEAVPPRLVFVSTPAPVPAPLDWIGLIEILIVSGISTFVGPSCSECEQDLWTACRGDQMCSDQVLRCLRDNVLGDAVDVPDRELLGSASARERLPELFACTSGVSPQVQYTIQSFLVCFEEAQCTTNEATSSTGSYLRLQRGKIRFSLSASSVNYFAATVTANDASNGVSSTAFQGSLENLRMMLQSLIDYRATVSVKSWQPASFPLDTLLVEITFGGYYGILPAISLPVNPSSSSYVERFPARMVLFSFRNETPSADKLSNTFSRFVIRPECNQNLCFEYLNACGSGDSRASLVCREIILPCFGTVFMNDVDFASELRRCTEHNILAGAIPLADFLVCYANSRCPLHEQDGQSVPTTLQIVAGSENLRLPNDPVTLTVYPPSDFSPAQYAFVDEFDYSGDLSAFMSYLQDEILDSHALVGVSSAPVDVDYSEIVITYRNYLGDLPTISGLSVQSLNRSLPQARTTSTSATEPRRWDYFRSLMQTLSLVADSQRGTCDSCALDSLQTYPQCVTLLSCLVQKLQPPISSQVTPISGSSTGTNITTALASCASGFTTENWRGTTEFFHCLMGNSCQIGASTLDPSADNATYLVLQNGHTSFEVPDALLPILLTVSAPPELGSVESSITLNPDDGISQLSSHLNSVLENAGAGYNAVTVTNSVSDRNGVVARKFTVSYQDYFGPLPVFSGPGVDTLASKAAQFSFQSLNGEAQWDRFLEMLAPYYVAPSQTPSGATPAPSPAAVKKVLANNCAPCGAAFFGCGLSAIADGSCSYATPVSLIAQCLTRTLDAATYQYLLSNGLGTELDWNNQLSDCYTEIQPTDESNAAASFRDDLWYVASEALACFDSNGCPLGPLDTATTTDLMVHLESTVSTRTLNIEGASFSAVFIATFGFRTLSSSAFTETATDEDLEALLNAILPSRTELVVSIALRGDSTGYDVTLEVSHLYFPAFDIQILVNGATNAAGSIQDAWLTKLMVNPFDSELVATLP